MYTQSFTTVDGVNSAYIEDLLFKNKGFLVIVERILNSSHIYLHFLYGHLPVNSTDASIICSGIERHSYSVMEYKFGNILGEFELNVLSNTSVRRTFPNEQGFMFYTPNHDGLKSGAVEMLERFGVAAEFSDEIMNCILYDFGMDGYTYI